MEEENPHLYDIRVVQRYINKGDVDARDYTSHLKSLPDLADSAEPLDIPAPGTGTSPLGSSDGPVAPQISEADNSEG